MGAASQFDLNQTLTVESTAMTDEVVPVVMASRRHAPSHFDRIFWVDRESLPILADTAML
jgi:hypothetical protein